MGELGEMGEEPGSLMTQSYNLISKLPTSRLFSFEKKKKLRLFKPLLFLVSALDF